MLRERGLRVAACLLAAALGSVEAVCAQEGGIPVEIHGFLEVANASRITGDPVQPDDLLLNEVRFRLDLSHYGDRSDLTFKGDFTADGVGGDVDIDVRQASITLQLTEWLDLRAGRQVLTWGTGDLVFLNDLFPKDFVSFFVGREDEFLKAPSNALRFTAHTGALNFDVVWTPTFEPDRFITGERLSFFDPSEGGLVSATTMGAPLQSLRPAKVLENGEFASRIFRNARGYELSAYGYWGFTKQPRAFDRAADRATHSRQAAYGASVRGAVFGGIVNAEGVFYDSADDAGTDPDTPNSEIRALVGYERELMADVTAGVQYYLQWLQDHEELVANSSTPQFEPDRIRHTFTSRLTYRPMQQTLTLSLFAFVSPSDGDLHLRPSVTKKWTDAVTLAAGANIMVGDESAFFGQLENNSNAYIRIRYSF